MISFGYDGNPDTHRSTYKVLNYLIKKLEKINKMVKRIFLGLSIFFVAIIWKSPVQTWIPDATRKQYKLVCEA